jgi:hypothetical protein
MVSDHYQGGAMTMKKKLKVLVLAVLLMISTMGYAAVPSKTTGDMATVAAITSVSGAPLAADFAVELIAEAPAASQELVKVAEVVSAGGTPVSYFADKQEGIALLVPEGFDANTLEMNEFSPLTAINYDENYGDVVVSFEFVTEYTDGQTVVAMVGVVTGVNADGTAIVEWYALKAEVNNGLVQVHFTQEVLAKLNGTEAMIAILSEPTA